jgi:replicative DNA helicase
MPNLMTPAHKEAERGVISRLLLKPSQMSRIAERLRADHFYHEEQAQIYDACISLYLRGKSPSLPNVADELIKRTLRDGEQPDVEYELQGYKYQQLDGSLEDYADLILRAAKNRRLMAASQSIYQAAINQQDDSLELAEQLILAIAMDTSEVEASPMTSLVDRFMREYERRKAEHAAGRVIGVQTGFPSVDRMIGSLRPGSLDILAALTSVGKTALAQNIAFNILKHTGGRVLFVSCEMTEDEIMQRFLAMEAHLDQRHIRDGDTDVQEHQDILDACENLRPLDLVVTDKVYRLDTIKSVARYAHMRKPLNLVIVDYLQLIDLPPAERGSRQQAKYEDYAEVSKGLKRLAQELAVPVVALAQLSKDATKREKPDISDLAGAYQIARDADTVSLLSVPPEELEKRSNCQPYQVNFAVVKERNGRVGEVRLMFLPTQTRFADLEVTAYD